MPKSGRRRVKYGLLFTFIWMARNCADGRLLGSARCCCELSLWTVSMRTYYSSGTCKVTWLSRV